MISFVNFSYIILKPCNPRNPRLKEVSRGFCPSLRIVTLLLDTQQFHFEYQSRERLDLATGFS